MNNGTDIGPRLAEAVALADDLTLRELDRLAGNKGQTLAARVIDGSRRNLSLAVAAAYAAVLGVSLDWLCGKPSEAPKAPAVKASVTQARQRYAATHPARGRKGAGRRVLAMLARARGAEESPSAVAV